MISNKLERIFLISLFLIYIHGVEEIIGGFQHFDSFMIFGAKYFSTTPEMFYWISHLIWWFSVPLIFIVFKKYRFILLIMAIYGTVFIIEFHHVIKAFIAKSYYPGTITALFYPLIGFFYWKELLKNWRSK